MLLSKQKCASSLYPNHFICSKEMCLYYFQVWLPDYLRQISSQAPIQAPREAPIKGIQQGQDMKV